MEPTSASIGAAAQVVRFAWQGIVAGRKLKQASQAIGTVVVDAIAKALCPADPDRQKAREAAEQIAAKLQELPVEKNVGSGLTRGQRAMSYLHSKVRPRQVPHIRPFAKERFEERLREWIEGAFADEEIQAQAAASCCHGGGLQEVAREFPECFLSTLEDAEETDWRDELLRALKEQTEGHEFLTRRRERGRDRRHFALGLTGAAAGAASGAAGGAIAGGSAESIVFGTLAGLAVGAIGGATGGRQRWTKGLTKAQIAAREGVLAWLTDLAKRAQPAADGAAGKKPPAEQLRWWEANDGLVMATFDDGLLEDLSGRLKSNAGQAGDDELLAGLITLETAVMRYRRGDENRDALVEALESVMATLQLTPDPTNRT